MQVDMGTPDYLSEYTNFFFSKENVLFFKHLRHWINVLRKTTDIGFKLNFLYKTYVLLKAKKSTQEWFYTDN